MTAARRREIPACGRQASLRSLRKITQSEQDDGRKAEPSECYQGVVVDAAEPTAA
jgi:hypothetical protein